MPRHCLFFKHFDVQLFANYCFERQLNCIPTNVIRRAGMAVCNEAFCIAQPFERQ